MNMIDKDLKTLAYVLRRTNYGEADRILNLITPQGKIAAMAKGARKEKSKLAGGIEMLSLVELNLHRGKGDFAIVTGAKMKKYYGNILKDYARMELMSVILKRVNAAAEHSDSPDFFRIVDACLKGLDDGTDFDLIKGWFVLNFLKASGEEVNLYRDGDGGKLRENGRYDWDVGQMVFVLSQHGQYAANEIKMLRLMTNTELAILKRVRVSEESMGRVMDFIRLMDVVEM